MIYNVFLQNIKHVDARYRERRVVLKAAPSFLNPKTRTTHAASSMFCSTSPPPLQGTHFNELPRTREGRHSAVPCLVRATPPSPSPAITTGSGAPSSSSPAREEGPRREEGLSPPTGVQEPKGARIEGGDSLQWLLRS